MSFVCAPGPPVKVAGPGMVGSIAEGPRARLAVAGLPARSKAFTHQLMSVFRGSWAATPGSSVVSVAFGPVVVAILWSAPP